MYRCGGRMRVISGSARGTKLASIESKNTRPTLDRVKESLFNILNNDINGDSVVLDLFAGSGAIGIEFLSRGAKKAVFVDCSREAVEMIKKNLEKTHLYEKAEIINDDYINALKKQKLKFTHIYLDPPYKKDFVIKALNIIEENKLLEKDGVIIIETDDPEEEKIIEDNIINYKICDTRKYGRAILIFLR